MAGEEDKAEAGKEAAATAAAAAHKSLLMDGFAWLSNVLSSILIIFITKWLMTSFGFKYATTICALHFLACAASIRSAAALGWIEHVPIPFSSILLFSVIGSSSIASANLSLLLNTVGFYQISKLLLAPFVCAVESLYFGKHFSMEVRLSILVVLVGVGIVTVSNVHANFLGTIMAAIFVVASGLQQVMCGHFQAKFNLAPHQLLANTSPMQGVLLLAVGPYLDRLVTGHWVLAWKPTETAIAVLLVSCVVAVVVNLSQFLCLGRFSATSFQVLGHAKTVLVLFGGWLLFDETVNLRQLTGMTLAVSGMVAYGYFMSQGGGKKEVEAPAGPGDEGAKVPLLQVDGSSEKSTPPVPDTHISSPLKTVAQ